MTWHPTHSRATGPSCWFACLVWLGCFLTLLTLCPQVSLTPSRFGRMLFCVAPEAEVPPAEEEEDDDEAETATTTARPNRHGTSRRHFLPVPCRTVWGGARTDCPREG